VGDHDRDGLADLSWTNLNTGELEIWFSNADSITAVAVAPTFGSATAGSASVVSGIQGSDDSVYRRRLCNGDFNGDDTVDWMDSNLVRGCYGSAATGACESVDMTSDGVVDEDDLDYFTAALARGDGCIQ
jgi:hypothetical protein